MTVAEAPRRRRGQSVGDMVRSFGLMAVVVAVTLVFVPGLFHPSKSQRFPAVDYSDYVTGFHRLSDRAALVPTRLPDSWKANAGRLTGTRRTAHLHIGWAVPGSDYAGLEESVIPAPGFIRSVLGPRGETVTGARRIGGVSWQQRTSARGELALTRTTAGLTVVVTGSASPQQLTTLAASLR